MKKLTFVAAMAIAAATLNSCGPQAPRANLKDTVDSLSYAIGTVQTNGLKDYLVMQMDVDTAYLADFVRGLNEGVNASDNKKKAAFYAGVQIGQQVSNQMIKNINMQLFGQDSTQSISIQNFMAGFITAVTEKKGLMTMDEARVLSDSLFNEVRSRPYLSNKADGEKFLAENATKEGVKTLPSGVQYKVIKEGNGPIPTDSQTVVVNYEGRLIDGTVFDSSYTRNQPATFGCRQVIKGWTDVLCHMPVGSEWEVYVPEELAYHNRQQGQLIKPYSALIFKIELLEIKK